MTQLRIKPSLPSQVNALTTKPRSWQAKAYYNIVT